MDFDRLTGGLTRASERRWRTSADVFEPVVRLGVTGLSRAGKTVFITSLVANLLERTRMPQLTASADGRILAAYLQPQPDHSIARFAFEDHLAALTGPDPHWPESTRSISTLRLSLRMAPSGLLGLAGPRIVHVDVVDYPGEWLLDLPLMSQDFEAWSARPSPRPHRRRGSGSRSLAGAARGGRPGAAARRGRGAGAGGGVHRLSGGGARGGAVQRRAGTVPDAGGPRGLAGAHLLAAAAAGADAGQLALARLRPAVRGLQAAGGGAVLPQPLRPARPAGGADRRARRDPRRAAGGRGPAGGDGGDPGLLPAGAAVVARADPRAADRPHPVRRDQGGLPAPRSTRGSSAIAEALVRDARARAQFSGAETRAMAIASLRATVEQTVTRDGREVEVVRGRLAGTGAEVALYPGSLPEDPAAILAPARQGAGEWADAAYRVSGFAPPVLKAPGAGLPHIRLDRAAEFLIGDRL